MRKYQKYKPSGVDWLGDIPEHWESLRFKNAANLILIKSNNDEIKVGLENIESQTAKYIFTSSNFEGDGIAFKKDDILYGKLRPYLCKVWVAEFNGSAVGDFFVLRCNLCVTYNYFKYFLLSHNFTDVSNGATYGTKMPRVGWEFLSNLIIFLPPPDEQAAIAVFLDEKCRLIEQTINSRRRQIELLKQERQAIISEAVTRGIDKNATLKLSGVEWLGDIPEHWVVWKISRAFRLIGSGTTPKSGLPEYYENGTEAWINTGDLNDNNLYNCSRRITIKALQNHSTLKVYPINTLLIALYGATIGKVSLMKFNACTNQACCALARSDVFDMQFVFYWFLANKQNLINMSYGGGQPNISQDIIKELKVPTPPIQEQQQIVSYIEEKTSKLDLVIQKYDMQIELLKEYKTALISQAVTGAIDVRNRVKINNNIANG